MTTFIFELKDTKGFKQKIHIKRKPSGKCDVFIKPTTTKTKTKRVKKGTKHNSNNALNSNNNS